jgi:hypothetical protein
MSIEKLVRFTSTFAGESLEIDDAAGQLFLNMEGLNEKLDITPNAAADTAAYLRDLSAMFLAASQYLEQN